MLHLITNHFNSHACPMHNFAFKDFKNKTSYLCGNISYEINIHSFIRAFIFLSNGML